MSESIAPTIEFTDEEYETRLNDPTLIETHEEAVAILGELDGEIAQIQGQLDQYAVEAQTRAMTDDRQAWFRRASTACGYKRGSRHRVIMRDKEIRGMKRLNSQPKKDPALKLVKQERLLAEVADRKASREQKAAEARLKLEQFQASRTRNNVFVNVCRVRLPVEQFVALMDETRAIVAAGNTKPEDVT